MDRKDLINHGPPLATLVHISDLHFDAVDRGAGSLRQGSASMSARDRSVYLQTPLLSGFLAHNDNAARALVTLFNDLRRSEGAKLVVSGDLTAGGFTGQFEAVREYLGAGIPTGKYGIPLGLKVGDWRSRTVPGNHDHWPGRTSALPPLPTIRGPLNQPQFDQTFNSPSTHVGPSIPLGRSGGWSLRLLHLNTDAQVDPWSKTHRWLAIGRFEQDIADLDNDPLLAKADEKEVRVLLLHHSISRSMTRMRNRIEAGSHAELCRVVHRHRISVLLCGDVHRTSVTSYPLGDRSVLEARCGTTTRWVRSLRKPPNVPAAQMKRLSENTALVHRLYDVKGAVYWDVEVHTWNERLARPGNHFGLQFKVDAHPRRQYTPFKVWPYP